MLLCTPTVQPVLSQASMTKNCDVAIVHSHARTLEPKSSSGMPMDDRIAHGFRDFFSALLCFAFRIQQLLPPVPSRACSRCKPAEVLSLTTVSDRQQDSGQLPPPKPAMINSYQPIRLGLLMDGAACHLQYKQCTRLPLTPNHLQVFVGFHQ
jgi:hypothetical protein